MKMTMSTALKNGSRGNDSRCKPKIDLETVWSKTFGLKRKLKIIRAYNQSLKTKHYGRRRSLTQEGLKSTKGRRKEKTGSKKSWNFRGGGMINLSGKRTAPSSLNE